MWRKDPTSPKFRDKFPYTLKLGVDTAGQSLLPFRPDDTSGNQILVTEAYDYMFHRLLGLRQRDRGKNKGAVLTGQPGIGVFLNQTLTPYDDSPVHPFSRKNYLSEVHARAPGFS